MLTELYIEALLVDEEATFRWRALLVFLLR